MEVWITHNNQPYRGTVVSEHGPITMVGFWDGKKHITLPFKTWTLRHYIEDQPYEEAKPVTLR